MTRSSWPLAIALGTLALAIVVFVLANRYQVQVLSGHTVVRTDRFTGAVTRCRAVADRTTFDCTTSDDEAAALRELEALADTTQPMRMDTLQ